MNAEHRCACASEEWRATVRDLIMPWVLADVDLGDHVIELGPGFGATTDVLRERVSRVTAVEIDPDLARDLAERLATSNVEVFEGDATALEFPDGSFSAAASFSMLHHVATPALQDRLFAEAGRVLRPGGILAATDSLDKPSFALSIMTTPSCRSTRTISRSACATPGLPTSRSSAMSSPGRRWLGGAPVAEAKGSTL